MKIILYYIFLFHISMKSPFCEKFTFHSKVQNVESQRYHYLHREVDPGNLTFSGVSECNTRIVSLSLQGNTELGKGSRSDSKEAGPFFLTSESP